MTETGGDKREAESERAIESRPPALPCEFQFVESPAEFRDAAAIIVRIPKGVRSKQKLFSIYANALRFPKYFGGNWDAFEECLRDLSWLPPNRSVVIVHEDLPFGSGGENRGIYIDVLRSAVASLSSGGNRSLRIVMPSELRASLNSAANEPR